MNLLLFVVSHLLVSPAVLLGIGAKIKTLITVLGKWLLGFGVFGLFLIALIDSSVLPMAGLPDLTLAVFCAKHPAMWLFYVAITALGATIGCFIFIRIVQRAGERFINRIQPERRRKIETMLGRYDAFTLAVVTLMPPPFPFKAFLICAAVMRISTPRLLAGLLIGRLLRCGLVGFLAARYGEQALEILKKHSGWLLLGLGVVVLGTFIYSRLFPSENTPNDAGAIQQPSDASS